MKKLMKRAVVMLTIFTMLCTTIPVYAGTTLGNTFDFSCLPDLDSLINKAIEANNEEPDTSGREDMKSYDGQIEDEEVPVEKELEEGDLVEENEPITVEPGTISGPTEVYVGSSVTLTGTVGATTSANGTMESWTADNAALVSIDENEHTAVVTGLSAGTVTITHTYFVKDPNVEVGVSDEAAYLTMTQSITMQVIAAPKLNHLKLDGERSSNITLYVTVGDGSGGLHEQALGAETVTEETDYYYFVRVKDGYAAETTFKHTWSMNDPTRTDYPTWSGTQTAYYHDIDNTTYSNMPCIADARALGCTYKGQYTGMYGGCSYFWVQFAIKADPIAVKVVYDANGGSGAPSDGNTYYHENVNEYSDHVITISDEEPTCEGKTFGGWQGSNGVIYRAGDTISIKSIWGDGKGISINGTSGTFTLTAVWGEKYSVSYQSNNATGGTAVVDMNQYDEGEKATVKTNTWLNYGYYFTGWNTEADGSGTSYKPGDSIALDSNVELYAQWSSQPATVVTLTANSASFKYDGTEHTVSGFEGLDSNNRKTFTVNGKTYTLDASEMSATASATDAGTVKTKVLGTYKIYDEDGNDVTDEIGSQIKISIETGTLTVTKRNITLTSQSASAEYTEGLVLTAPIVEVGGDGFVSGQGAEYTFSADAKVSAPNTSVLNTYSYSFTDNTNPLNYNITKLEGTLTMTAPPEKVIYTIQVETNSATYVYDGQEHTVGGFKNETMEYAVVVDGEVKIFTVSGLQVETVTAKNYVAGGYPINITGTAIVTDENGNDVSDQFIIDPKPGTLMITQRQIMLRSESAQKVYDGTPLTAENVIDSYNVNGATDEAGFVNGEGATYTFTGSQTIPGASENTFTYELNDGTLASNYKISTDNGTLNVQSGGGFTITLQPKSGEVVYDGTEQTVEGFEQTTFIFNDQEYTVTNIEAVAKGTNPGVYESSYSGTPIVLDADGNDVTSEFTIDLSNVGTLRIKGVYTVTINYVDTAGRTVAPSHEERFVEGASFGPIVSPTVEGYTPNFASVSSPGSGMPNVDVTVNVIYTANPNAPATATPTPTATTGNNGGGGGTTGTTPDNTTGTGTTADNGTTPAADNTAGTTPAATAVTTTTVAAIPVTLAANGEPEEDFLIADEETPLGVISIDGDGNAEIIDIEDDPTALASGAEGAAWALINLIAAILTAVICIILLISLFKRNKDEEEEQDKNLDKDEAEKEEKKKKQRFIAKLLSILPAAAAVIIFFITENLKNPMTWVDKWTILMLVILLVQIVLAVFSSKKKKKDKDDEDK